MSNEVKKKSKLWKWIRVTLYLLLGSVVAIIAIAFLFLWYIASHSGEQIVDRHTQKSSLGFETQHQPMTRDEFKDFELKRDSLARQINSEIRRYYMQNGFYPKRLQVLPVAKTDTFNKYHHGIRYLSDLKTFYKLNWLASSPWNGMQCVAGDTPNAKLPQELGTPYYDNCYVNDLH